MKVLELFSGTGSFGNVAKELGHEVFSSDIMQRFNSDYTVDILDFDISKVPFVPDIIWASPPCTTFSVASFGHHWLPNKEPRTEAAKIGIAIAKKTLEIISHFPNAVFYIENPRGLLRKMDFMQPMKRHTVTYCQYGDSRMKPTDIWTNDEKWNPKKMCKNGDDCHVRAPRGARTGTQGLKSAEIRSIVPKELCLEILNNFQ